ncbi:Gp37 family protein [Citrobacter portucalensis]|uniref:Gp37 family protein n=1 Tax=Citrobacter portucalensis TaxID=1639133 RepID=UPI00226BAE3C|nr:Gp37 family protein [Citrobacter portucalensis]MCX9038485.1 Gp37 family protein [Citrobacter portucalensis]
MNIWPVTEALLARLKVKFPGLHVEYFPEKPDDFRLNHPTGALLVSYGKSTFGPVQDVGAVLQAQTARFSVTVVMRQLNGADGAVAVLDLLRQALGGWCPPNCRRAIWMVSDTFIGQVSGLWQYDLMVATETVFVQDSEPDDGPLLKKVEYVYDGTS